MCKIKEWVRMCKIKESVKKDIFGNLNLKM